MLRIGPLVQVLEGATVVPHHEPGRDTHEGSVCSPLVEQRGVVGHDPPDCPLVRVRLALPDAADSSAAARIASVSSSTARTRSEAV